MQAAYLAQRGASAATFWFGLSDSVSEGQFRWRDGSLATFTNWAPNEPNSAGNEDCGQVYGDDPFLWNDQPCVTSTPYMCSKTL
mmetsp:Transcript_35700/g.84947  ORF Transcript_35700/g.84947 Transcript_35700/m.84947 type:complete len:84 (-) Transcript_35700:171-422(-)